MILWQHWNLFTIRLLQAKWLKKTYFFFYKNESVFYFTEDFGDVTFCCNELGILSVNHNNINLGNDLDEGVPDYQTFGFEY